MAASPSLAPLTDTDMSALETALDAVPAPLEPLDLSMLDGFLCGVLLQPEPVPEAEWLRHVFDADGRPLPRGFDPTPIAALARRRHAELNRAIHGRQWFDPWIFELEDEDGDEMDPLATVMPWAAGFALAMEFFPQLMRQDPQQVMEPLAAIYRAFDPDDLEDADELLAAIEELEPPSDLGEAVEALVSSTLLLADVTRPQSGASRPTGTRRPGPRPGGAGARPVGGKKPPRRTH